jgi:YD repeat-containing protein
MGNLTAVTIKDRTMRFNYDQLNRLTEIVTLDGKRLSYHYQDGEPDLRLQMDHHSGRNLSERMTSGLTFSSGLELIKNRTEGNSFGVVRFDQAMIDYRLASEFGVMLPDAVQESAMARIRVMGLGESTFEAKKSFDAPSNVMFIPAEYWAVNCCPGCPNPLLDCSLCEPGGGGGGDPQGACCLDASTGNCVQKTAAECSSLGGTYYGDGTTCGAGINWQCCPNKKVMDDMVECPNGDGTVTICPNPRVLEDPDKGFYVDVYGVTSCNKPNGQPCVNVQILWNMYRCASHS